MWSPSYGILGNNLWNWHLFNYTSACHWPSWSWPRVARRPSLTLVPCDSLTRGGMGTFSFYVLASSWLTVMVISPVFESCCRQWEHKSRPTQYNLHSRDHPLLCHMRFSWKNEWQYRTLKTVFPSEDIEKNLTYLLVKTHICTWVMKGSPV